MDTKPRPTAIALLRQFSPCPDAALWIANKSPRQAWLTCERGDWLLWAAARLGIERTLLVRAACACARLALPYAAAGEDRPRIAIETAERWCVGGATIEEVRAAGDDAHAAAVYATAYAAHAAAVYATAYAAYYAAYAAYATHAATHAAAYRAAYAAYAAYADAYADAATRARFARQCADEVRHVIPWAAIVALLATVAP